MGAVSGGLRAAFGIRPSQGGGGGGKKDTPPKAPKESAAVAAQSKPSSTGTQAFSPAPPTRLSNAAARAAASRGTKR